MGAIQVDPALGLDLRPRVVVAQLGKRVVAVRGPRRPARRPCDRRPRPCSGAPGGRRARAAAAASSARVPATLIRPWSARPPPPRCAAQCTTASMPATARSSVCGAVRSPSATSTSRGRRSDPERQSARTASPSASRRVVTYPPTSPVAPVTSTFMPARSGRSRSSTARRDARIASSALTTAAPSWNGTGGGSPSRTLRWKAAISARIPGIAAQAAGRLAERTVHDAERRLRSGRGGDAELRRPPAGAARHPEQHGPLPGEIHADRALVAAQHDAQLPRRGRERDAHRREAARARERHAQLRAARGSACVARRHLLDVAHEVAREVEGVREDVREAAARQPRDPRRRGRVPPGSGSTP